MAEREYRELSCRDTGEDCDFFVRAETPDEIMSVISAHACRAHSLCQMSPEALSGINSIMRSVRCGGEISAIQENTPDYPRGEWRED